MTNAKVGSHRPRTSRKPNTFAGCVMPEITRPAPKISPHRRLARIFIGQAPRAWRMTATTMAAIAIKTMVATIERVENRAIPQTPCPDVQPPPSREPKPTSRPATPMSSQLVGIWGSARGRPAKPKRIGAPIRPARNANRQPLSRVAVDSAPPRIPLTPAMRPFKTISNAEARPIKQPPSKAEVGSNDATIFLPLGWGPSCPRNVPIRP